MHQIGKKEEGRGKGYFSLARVFFGKVACVQNLTRCRKLQDGRIDYIIKVAKPAVLLLTSFYFSGIFASIEQADGHMKPINRAQFSFHG